MSDTMQLLESAVTDAIELDDQHWDRAQRIHNLQVLDSVLCRGDVNVNKLYPMENTMLQLAVVEGDIDVVDTLLKRGANPNMVFLGKYFEQNSLWQCFDCPYDDKRYDIALALIRAGAYIDTRFSDRHCTLLEMCCRKRDVRFARILLEHNANVHTMSRGQTLLYSTVGDFSSWGNIIEMIQLLIHYGVDITQKTDKNETLLHVMARGPRSFDYDLITFLVEHGVEDSRDNNNMTAGDIALDMALTLDNFDPKYEEFARRLEQIFKRLKNKMNVFALRPHYSNGPPGGFSRIRNGV
jgi:ankyrin repeat protein